MATIDKLLNMMVVKKIDRVILINDAPMKVFSAGREIPSSPNTVKRLQSIVEEILPPLLIPEMRSDDNFQYPYTSPHGKFYLKCSRKSEVLQVIVTPVNPSWNSEVSLPSDVGLCQNCGSKNSKLAKSCRECQAELSWSHTKKEEAGSVWTADLMPFVKSGIWMFVVIAFLIAIGASIASITGGSIVLYMGIGALLGIIGGFVLARKMHLLRQAKVTNSELHRAYIGNFLGELCAGLLLDGLIWWTYLHGVNRYVLNALFVFTFFRLVCAIIMCFCTEGVEADKANSRFRGFFSSVCIIPITVLIVIILGLSFT